MIPTPNINELVKRKLMSILENTLEKFPQYTREQIRDSVKHTFYHKYENFEFLFMELENVKSLTLEQIEAFIREEEFIQSIFDNKEI